VIINDKRGNSLERVIEKAKNGSVENEFASILEFADEHQLFIRSFKKSIFLAPAKNHTIALCVFSPDEGFIRVWIGFSNFEIYLKIPKEKMQAIFDTIDDKINIILTSANIDDFLEKMNSIWL
jgi:hypothetical protein